MERVSFIDSLELFTYEVEKNFTCLVFNINSIAASTSDPHLNSACCVPFWIKMDKVELSCRLSLRPSGLRWWVTRCWCARCLAVLSPLRCQFPG